MLHRSVVSLDSWLREQQIGRVVTYETDGFSIRTVDRMPDGVALLVRAVGICWTQHIYEGIQRFNEEKPLEERAIVYAVGRRKDDISYYVQERCRDELSEYLKTRSPPEPPHPPRRPARRIFTATAYQGAA